MQISTGKKPRVRKPPRFPRNLLSMINDEMHQVDRNELSRGHLFKEELVLDALPNFFKNDQLTNFQCQLLMYQFSEGDEPEEQGCIDVGDIYLNWENYNSLSLIHRKPQNEQKLVLNFKEIGAIVQQQTQMIFGLQKRTSMLENSMMCVRDNQVNVAKKMLSFKDLLAILTCDGVNSSIG